MNDLTTRAQSPVAQFKGNLARLIEAKELALPSNVSVEAFRNAAVVAVQENPKILQCDQQSLFKSLRSLAAAGLVPDGREAALVPFKTKENGNYIDKCQAMPMVFGLLKSARRSGDVRDIRAHLVYQRELDEERFTYVVGDDERLEHQPILFGERGEAVACYAIAKLRDGTIVREFMSAQDIDKVRRAGASQKIFEKGKAPRVSDEPKGIWADWSEEMWKKTVIRRLCKRLDLSAEDMRTIMAEPDFDGMRDVSPEQPQKRGFAARAQEARQQEDRSIDDTIDGTHAEVEEALEGFPGAEEWTEGVKAAQAGQERDDCPYDAGQKRADWLGGWDGFQQAKETTE